MKYDSDAPVDVILLTGDLVAHFISIKASATPNTEKDKKQYEYLKEIHIAVAKMFKTYLPNTPVFFSLGNNDAKYHY